MSKNEIDDFSDDSIKEIADVVRRMRWMARNIKDIAKAVRRYRPTHEIRTGRTQARENETYPESGCVLPVQFTDLAFSETVGQCDELEIAPWPSKFVSARNMEGGYLPEGENVLIVKTPGLKGRRWWFISGAKNPGRIGFLMTSVRSRLRHPDNSRYGEATAIVQWVAGDVPCSVGDTITITFPNDRWFGAVANCNGEADYFSSYTVPDEQGEQTTVNADLYIVTECQEMPSHIEAVITEDRDRDIPNQKVKAVPRVAYGQTNGDLPLELWYQQTPGEFDCGTTTWRWNVSQHAWLVVEFSNFNTCCTIDYTGPPTPPDPQNEQLDIILPFGNAGPNCNPPTEQSDFTVLYPQLKWKRAVAGAEVLCFFDVRLDSDDPADACYVVMKSDELPIHIEGTLPDDNCGQDFSVDSAAGLDEWPNGQEIPSSMFPISLYNYKAGRAGDKFTAVWDKSKLKYKVIEIKEHAVDLLTDYDITQDGECYTVTANIQPAYVNLCVDPTPIVLDQYRIAEVNRFKEIRLVKNQSGSGEQITCEPSLEVELYQEYARVACPDPVTRVTSLDLESLPVVIDYDADGCPIWSTQSYIVFGGCGDPQIHEADCEPCEDESGSG